MMDWQISVILIFGFFVLLAVPGLWVAMALGVGGIIAMVFIPRAQPQVIANVLWTLSTNFTLTAIPLFLLMGEFIIESGVSKRFYRGVAKYIRNIPGGMLLSNIVACGIFSAISGSAPATAAAIGGVAIPELDALGYRKRYTYGSILGGGTLGILIPPSLALIIYGSLTGLSVVQLFAAALIPGIVLCLIYMAYIVLLGITRRKEFANIKWDYYETVGHGEALASILPMVIMIATVLGTLYAGVVTPTEAAAVGALMALIIGKVFGSLNFKLFWKACNKAVRTTTMILFIIFGANIFSYVMSISGATIQIVTWLTDLNLSTVALLFMVYLIYILLGLFLEGIAMQFLTLPVLFPVMMAYGFDGIWFGIVLVILIQIGLVTPPVGMNLFIVKGISKDAKMSEIIIGALPYIVCMLLMLMILTFFPQLTAIFRI